MEKPKQKSALKAGTWYTICNFLTSGLAFLVTPIFTRLMTKGEIGDFSGITAWVSILVSVVTLDLHASVNLARFDYEKDLDGFMSSILVFGTIITAIFYGVVYIFKGTFLSLFNMPEYAMHIIFTYMLVSPAMLILQARYRAKLEYKPNIAITLTNVFLSTGCAILLVLCFKNKVLGRLLGSYGAQALFMLGLYIFILVRGKKVKISYWKYAVAIALPTVFHVLANSILSSSDRIMIKNIVDSDSAALYTIAYNCAMPISILWSSLNSAWAPWSYERMHNHEYDTIKKYSKPYAIGFGVVVAGLLLLAPEVLLIMGGKQYMSAVYVIPPVMLGFVCQFVYSLYVNVEIMHKKQWLIALGTFTAAAVNIGLNAIFIPRFGYIAAAYTTLVGYLVLLIMHFLFVKLIIKKTFIYDTRFNGLYLAVMAVVAAVANLLYPWTIVRYSVIAVIAVAVVVFAIKNKQVLFEKLKEFRKK